MSQHGYIAEKCDDIVGFVKESLFYKTIVAFSNTVEEILMEHCI
jgi:hypothetical protein